MDTFEFSSWKENELLSLLTLTAKRMVLVPHGVPISTIRKTKRTNISRKIVFTLYLDFWMRNSFLVASWSSMFSLSWFLHEYTIDDCRINYSPVQVRTRLEVTERRKTETLCVFCLTYPRETILGVSFRASWFFHTVQVKDSTDYF